jgi:hypothetical protein
MWLFMYPSVTVCYGLILIFEACPHTTASRLFNSTSVILSFLLCFLCNCIFNRNSTSFTIIFCFFIVPVIRRYHKVREVGAIFFY